MLKAFVGRKVVGGSVVRPDGTTEPLKFASPLDARRLASAEAMGKSYEIHEDPVLRDAHDDSMWANPFDTDHDGYHRLVVKGGGLAALRKSRELEMDDAPSSGSVLHGVHHADDAERLARQHGYDYAAAATSARSMGSKGDAGHWGAVADHLATRGRETGADPRFAKLEMDDAPPSPKRRGRRPKMTADPRFANLEMDDAPSAATPTRKTYRHEGRDPFELELHEQRRGWAVARKEEGGDWQVAHVASGLQVTSHGQNREHAVRTMHHFADRVPDHVATTTSRSFDALSPAMRQAWRERPGEAGTASSPPVAAPLPLELDDDRAPAKVEKRTYPWSDGPDDHYLVAEKKAGWAVVRHPSWHPDEWAVAHEASGVHLPRGWAAVPGVAPSDEHPRRGMTRKEAGEALDHVAGAMPDFKPGEEDGGKVHAALASSSVASRTMRVMADSHTASRRKSDEADAATEKRRKADMSRLGNLEMDGETTLRAKSTEPPALHEVHAAHDSLLDRMAAYHQRTWQTHETKAADEVLQGRRAPDAAVLSGLEEQEAGVRGGAVRPSSSAPNAIRYQGGRSGLVRLQHALNGLTDAEQKHGFEAPQHETYAANKLIEGGKKRLAALRKEGRPYHASLLGMIERTTGEMRQHKATVSSYEPPAPASAPESARYGNDALSRLRDVASETNRELGKGPPSFGENPDRIPSLTGDRAHHLHAHDWWATTGQYRPGWRDLSEYHHYASEGMKEAAEETLGYVARNYRPELVPPGKHDDDIGLGRAILAARHPFRGVAEW